MKKATLLFAQNAIKAAEIIEDTLELEGKSEVVEYIRVHYGDGKAPILIDSNDVMYEFHKKQFRDLIDQNLKTLEDAANIKEPTEQEELPLKIAEDNTEGDINDEKE